MVWVWIWSSGATNIAGCGLDLTPELLNECSGAGNGGGGALDGKGKQKGEAGAANTIGSSSDQEDEPADGKETERLLGDLDAGDAEASGHSHRAVVDGREELRNLHNSRNANWQLTVQLIS